MGRVGFTRRGSLFGVGVNAMEKAETGGLAVVNV